MQQILIKAGTIDQFAFFLLGSLPCWMDNWLSRWAENRICATVDHYLDKVCTPTMLETVVRGCEEFKNYNGPNPLNIVVYAKIEEDRIGIYCDVAGPFSFAGILNTIGLWISLPYREFTAIFPGDGTMQIKSKPSIDEETYTGPKLDDDVFNYSK